MRDNPKYTLGAEKFYAMRMPYDTFAEYEQAMRFNKAHANFSKEQIANIKELNELLPVVQGQIMPFGAADSKHPNPNFSIENAVELGYHHNCQTCTVVYEMRRRGFIVEASPSKPTNGGKSSEFWSWANRNNITDENRFLTPDGKPATYSYAKSLKDAAAREAFIESETKTVGRYEVFCRWNNEASAHVFIVERQKNDNLLWYDPQSGAKADDFRERYLAKMSGKDKGIGVRRIDDKLINPTLCGRMKKSE